MKRTSMKVRQIKHQSYGDPALEDPKQPCLQLARVVQPTPNPVDLDLHYRVFDDELHTKFYFISTNILYKANRMYVPVEITITEFSYERGITRTFHKNLKQKIPNGLRFECEVQTQRHKIDTDQGEENYVSIFFDILQFFHYPNEIILFCEDSKLEQNISIALWLHQQYRTVHTCNLTLKVYGYQALAHYFFQKSGSSMREENLPNLMQKTMYDSYFYDLCQYHQVLRCKECSFDDCHKLVYVFIFAMAAINHLPLMDQIPNLDALKPYLTKIGTKYCLEKSDTLNHS